MKSGRVLRALRYSVGTRRRLLLNLSVSFSVAALFLLGSFPEYSYQLLSADLLYLGTSLETLTATFYASSGFLGSITLASYSLAAGTSVTVLLTSNASKKKALASSPAFLVGGCAGCGVGILGLIGLSGLAALLPFSGNGIRLLGTALLLLFLHESGDPETCRVKQSEDKS